MVFVIFVCLSVCLSIYVSFTEYWNAVESLNFGGKLPYMLVNGVVILRPKIKGQGHYEQKCKNRFFRVISSSKVVD